MKSLFLILSACLLFIACKEEPAEQEVKIEKIEPEIPEEDTFPYDTLEGIYMADFAGSPIRIVLNYVSGANAIGYNLHKGLQRNIMGEVTRSRDSIQLVLSEPGDNEYDGVFTLSFIGMNDAKPTGSWEANNKKIPGQQFTMKRIVKPTDESTEEVTLTNFARIFGEMSDSIGEYNFSDDGLVRLKYYPDKDIDWDKQQYKELKGSWDLDGNRVVINWEPSDIFKGNRLELTIKKYEYGEYSLVGDGEHELWMMWYP